VDVALYKVGKVDNISGVKHSTPPPIPLQSFGSAHQKPLASIAPTLISCPGHSDPLMIRGGMMVYNGGGRQARHSVVIMSSGTSFGLPSFLPGWGPELVGNLGPFT